MLNNKRQGGQGGGTGGGMGMRATRFTNPEHPDYIPPATTNLQTTWTQPPPPPTGTGGNLPPLVQPVRGTGGNLPPVQGKPPQGTGGNLPPLSNTQSTGGNLPPVQAPNYSTGGNLPANPINNTQGTGGNLPPLLDPVTGQPLPQTVPQQNLQGGFSPVNVVTDTLGQIIDPNGAYMRNAQRRGLEQAAAGGNRAGGSIAAGAAQRAMMEAAQPLVNNALQLQGQREGYAFQGEQSQLERNRDYTQAQLQNWMDSNKFNREFYGALSMMPINSAYQLNGLIQTYALENPDVYTADVISGMSNFFNQNFTQILGTYFPSLYGSGTNTGGP